MLFFILLAAAVASHAQTSGQLPQKWDEAVRALAENIAAAARPARTISLDVKNISSLASTDAGVVQQALESDLTHRGFHFDAASSAEARVEVTLSEAAEKYVWVAETHVGDADRVAIFDVVRTPDFSTQKEVDSVVLDRKLVWQQPGKILKVELLGYNRDLNWKQIDAALKVQMPAEKISDIGITLKVGLA